MIVLYYLKLPEIEEVFYRLPIDFNLNRKYLSLMIKPFLHLLLLILLPLSLFGQQNLVPNFSFEQYDTCPNSQDQIQFATGWSKYSMQASTPDYFNSCAPAASYSVPKSSFNNQAAHRNCNAYAALIIWGASGNDREHIGIQLSQPLIVGQKYFLSFYTVMTESYLAGTYFGMPSNNIGLRLSTVEFNPSNPTPIDNFAHLHSPVIINDSINWIRVSGSIVADSAYNYLIVGNFFDDANTDTMRYSCASCINAHSYYLVDDICVSTDSLLCNGGIDLLLCITSISEQNLSDKINVFPNPVTDMITISFPGNQGCEFILSDTYGKIIYTEKVNDKKSLMLDLSAYSPGIYFLKVVSHIEEKIFVKKIVKL